MNIDFDDIERKIKMKLVKVERDEKTEQHLFGDHYINRDISGYFYYKKISITCF